MTTNTNNALVHKYLIPLIENIDFSDCDNNSTIKAVINKLMTVAKNTMNTEKEPGDTSDVKIDNMKGATIKDSTDEGASDKDVDKTVNVDKPTKVAFDQSISKKPAKKPVKTTKKIQYNKQLLEKLCLRDECIVNFTTIEKYNRNIKVDFTCKCGNTHNKTFRVINNFGGFCKICTNNKEEQKEYREQNKEQIKEYYE